MVLSRTVRLRRSAILPFIALAAVILVASLPISTRAQTGPRCFSETSQCVAGPVYDYWEANGGLPVFGYPITAQREEVVEGRRLQVQWFERDRLEIQADGQVTAGRLGARVLELEWRPWERFPPASGTDPDCEFFPATNHTACGTFLAHWRANGGLERFGYPITEAFTTTIEDRSYTVQYFERRRMELHPELPGNSVLLGLLGNEVLRLTEHLRSADNPCLDGLSPVMRQAYDKLIYPEILGCPVLYAPTDMPAAIQQFENGEMIWFQPPTIRVPGGLLPPTIFAYIQAPGASFANFRTYTDEWQAGEDPDTPDASPPAGRYLPWHGFGKVWAEDQELRERIGWATELRPQSRRADYQLFEGGILVRIYEPGAPGVVYAFSNPAIPTLVQKVVP